MNESVSKIFVNGRFLGRRLTGVDRFAIEVLAAIDQLCEDHDGEVANLEFCILVPPGTVPMQTFRHLPILEVGTRQGHLWEQIDLAWAAKAGLLLSLCNTGPIFQAKHVVAIHDAATVSVPRTFSLSFRFWYRILMPLLGRCATTIATVSEFSRRELQQHFGIPRAKLKVVSEGGEHILRVTTDATALQRLD